MSTDAEMKARAREVMTRISSSVRFEDHNVVAFDLAQALTEAVAAEREACAKIADKKAQKWQRIVNGSKTTAIGGACAASSVEASAAIAAAIRSRSEA